MSDVPLSNWMELFRCDGFPGIKLNKNESQSGSLDDTRSAWRSASPQSQNRTGHQGHYELQLWTMRHEPKASAASYTTRLF